MSSKKLPRIVEVEWLDSVSTGAWRGVEERLEATAAEDMNHRTAGYLLKSEKTFVVIAQSLGDHNPTCADTIQIPRRAIKRIMHIKRET